MKRVILFSLTNENIKISIEAYFDALGNLVIDGYDIGKTVSDYWGDSDYEYITTITPDEVEKIYPLFQLEANSGEALLLALKNRFNTNTCYSDLQKFLDLHNIKYSGFSWR